MTEFKLMDCINVTQSLNNAFRYLAHFENIQEWDPGVNWCRPITLAEPRIGSEYLLSFRTGLTSIEIRYRIIELDPGKRLKLEGIGAGFKAIDEIEFSAADAGCKINYAAHIVLDTSLPRTILQSVMQIVGKRAMNGLKRALRAPAQSHRLSVGSALEDRLIAPGVANYSAIGWHRHKPYFQGPLPSLADKWVLITGATSGLGLSVAERLASNGANLLLVGRDQKKLEAVRTDFLKRGATTQIELLKADLSCPSDLPILVEAVQRKTDRLHALINNAGILNDQFRINAAGVEESTYVNLFAPYFLMHGLRDFLKRDDGSRIVNVSSGGMYTQRLAMQVLKNPGSADFDGTVAYAQAKRGLVILTEELAKDSEFDGIGIHAMHPGWVDTPGVRSSLPKFYKATKAILRTAEQGSDTITWLASATASALGSGQFWFDRSPRSVYLIPGTKEPATDREALMKYLAEKFPSLKDVHI
jgi:dehydrogenase/reductase SDR family protein 12